MFEVVGWVKDYEDNWPHVLGEFATEKEAEEFMAVEERSGLYDWYEVREN
jgi:hypothetical protein